MNALLLNAIPITADERALLTLALQRAGLHVDTGDDLGQALAAWSVQPADLIVAMLSEAHALPQVQQMRREAVVPLLVIIDGLTERLHIRLLEAGADLVLGHPYSATLLIAQLHALRRRAASVPLTTLVAVESAGLTLDPATRSVRRDDQRPQRLTSLEFRLLYALMTHPGQTLSSETLIERVWGYTGEGDRELVRNLISRLRHKLGDQAKQPRYIFTVTDVGYVFR